MNASEATPANSTPAFEHGLRVYWEDTARRYESTTYMTFGVAMA